MPLLRQVRRRRGLAELAKQHGLRLTSQRRVIFSILESANTHLNAKQILEEARKVAPGIDQVTVYRNLAVLKQLGVVDELDLLHLRGDEHYYEAKQTRAHSHVACLACGKVFEYYTPAMKRIHQELEREVGFSVSFSRIEIGGYCAACRDQGLAATPEASAAAKRRS
ncbi:MAG TPA: Fur family transcriptional regulator [Terriglobia bacterium]|nr:Fur family transcriptional regulator [Terriglobia bacterium]